MTIEPLSPDDAAYALGYRWRHWDGDTLFLNKTKTGLMRHVERTRKNRDEATLMPGRGYRWGDFKLQAKGDDDDLTS